jgi:TldD protein
MNAISPAPSILDSAGVDPERAGKILNEALQGADDGELFVERSESESFLFDDGRLKSAAYDATEGFGLRVVAGETAGYAHASEISEAAIGRAAASAALAKRGYSGVAGRGPPRHQRQALRRGEPPRIAGLRRQGGPAAGDRQPGPGPATLGWCRLMALLAGERRTIEILRADGRLIRDVRPLARINVQITVEGEGKRESGYSGAGGRAGFETWITPQTWHSQVERRCARPWSTWSLPCPAGEMDVVLGPAGTACCCTRRSATAWRRLQPQGHLGLLRPHRRAGGRAGRHRVRRRHDPGRRGSLTVDDEGTPTERTILIEDGILVGYMHDRMSARLMGLAPTGNARRQSYAHMPMPRMTNTGMLGGDHTARR